MELKGELNKAIEFYEECFSINKKYLGCLKKLIELNLMSKNFEESIKFCMKHLNINDKSGANEDYNKAIQINPKDASSYFNRGVTKCHMGICNEAIEDYKKALKLDPTNMNYKKAIKEAQEKTSK